MHDSWFTRKLRVHSTSAPAIYQSAILTSRPAMDWSPKKLVRTGCNHKKDILDRSSLVLVSEVLIDSELKKDRLWTGCAIPDPKNQTGPDLRILFVVHYDSKSRPIGCQSRHGTRTSSQPRGFASRMVIIRMQNIMHILL